MLNADGKPEERARIPEWAAALDEIVAKSQERLIGIRRHLHQHPELSAAEQETTRYLSGLIEELDLEVRTGPRDRGLIIDSRPPQI